MAVTSWRRGASEPTDSGDHLERVMVAFQIVSTWSVEWANLPYFLR